MADPQPELNPATAAVKDESAGRPRTRKPRSGPTPPEAGAGSELSERPIHGATNGTPEQVLRSLGNEFIRNRKKSKAQAYGQLQEGLAANLSTLCRPDMTTGSVPLTLKDALATLRENEEFLKGQETTEISPIEGLRKWLNGEAL